MAVITCLLFLFKADLKRNISLLQAEVQKKDGMLLFQSSVSVKVCHLSLCLLVYHSPLYKKEEAWAESYPGITCGTVARHSLASISPQVPSRF